MLRNHLRVFAKTTARIDSKRSVITKIDPKRVLHGLKSPVLVLSGRYRGISVFPSRPTAIFNYLPSTSVETSFYLLQRFRRERRRPRAISLLIIRPTKETFTSRTKILCLRLTNQANQADLHRQVHVHAGILCKFNHHKQACI